jgi:hypothetical protein
MNVNSSASSGGRPAGSAAISARGSAAERAGTRAARSHRVEVIDAIVSGWIGAAARLARASGPANGVREVDGLVGPEHDADRAERRVGAVDRVGR